MASRTKSESPLSNMGTSVLDLSLLMVVCLLTLGGTLMAMKRLSGEPVSGESAPPPPHTSAITAEHDRLSRELAEMARTLDEQDAEDAALARRAQADTAERSRLRLLASALRGELAVLLRALNGAGDRERDLREIDEVLGDRNRELAVLRERLATLRRKLESLRGQIVEAQHQVTVAHSKGGVRVRDLNSELAADSILLHHGKAYVIKPGVFKGTRLPGGEILIQPVGDGLSMEAALKAGSDFMGMISARDYKNKRFVYFLVTPDSFGAFWSLRAVLTARDIRCGWEPVDDERIFVSESGRSPAPQ